MRRLEDRSRRSAGKTGRHLKAPSLLLKATSLLTDRRRSRVRSSSCRYLSTKRALHAEPKRENLEPTRVERWPNRNAPWQASWHQVEHAADSRKTCRRFTSGCCRRMVLESNTGGAGRRHRGPDLDGTISGDQRERRLDRDHGAGYLQRADPSVDAVDGTA